MLMTEEFQDWCQRLQISPETEAMITRIRSSPPVRNVRSRANNVSGKYPSPKMRRSIQFESQHVELWGRYGMERDDGVREYTVAALCEEGGTALTREALEQHALQPDQRVHLEMGARAGERKVEEG